MSGFSNGFHVHSKKWEGLSVRMTEDGQYGVFLCSNTNVPGKFLAEFSTEQLAERYIHERTDEDARPKQPYIPRGSAKRTQAGAGTTEAAQRFRRTGGIADEG